MLLRNKLVLTVIFRNDHWVLGIIDDPGAATAESDDRTP